MASRRSGGGEREGGGGSRKSPRISSRSIAVDDEETMRWYVADIQHPLFGKEFSDARAIKKGTRVGDRCIIEAPEGPLVLQQSNAPLSCFHSDFMRKAKPQLENMGYVSPTAGSPIGSIKGISSIDDSSGHKKRRSELSHMDITEKRPAFVPRRVIYGMVLFSVHVYLSYAWYRDQPPSIFVPLLVTFLYPLLLLVATRQMAKTSMPADRYVFEFLLAFDVYQTVTSGAILYLSIKEAYSLGMLNYVWGNDASISSPLLRLLLWLHYENRVLELLDTFVRISQKRLRAYGSLHVYLRIVSVWSWWVACCVGGGDAYFLVSLDAFVCLVRFSVFTLSILRWNFNWSIDFGMHAPKVPVFKSEHLYHLQVAEFYICLIHALFALVRGNMPPATMAMQVIVMVSGACIFSDFYVSRDQQKVARTEYNKERLIISFDSSAWLFMYHFGVAMFIEDHIDHKKPESIGYSGSSGGALVAGTLSSGIDAQQLSSFVIENSWPVAGHNPFRLLGQCEIALDNFLPKDAHETSTSVLRVLLTKVSRKPPFLMGEVVSRFSSWPEIFSCLRASCHMPLFGGLLPYPVLDHGWYYDGLLWNSLFVPWRTFDHRDSVIKVSAFGHPGADIYPTRFIIPPWMCVFPPNQECLKGMVAMGYSDASDFFEGKERRWGGGVVENVRGRGKIEQLKVHARKKPLRFRLDDRDFERIDRLRRAVVLQWKLFGLVVTSGMVTVTAYLMGAFNN